MENGAAGAGQQCPALVIQGLSFTYPERETPALDHVSLEVQPGEFVVLCGPSGCGKTTLLRQLKPALAPHGRLSGAILVEGQPLSGLSARDAAAKIGFVLQHPEDQIVTDKVWHELAFGLESLGFDTPAIRLRVAEIASFFGIQDWFYRNVAELSGGQKQLLALASVMAMQPSLLILDEPTSQLDPIAAADFLSAVGRINRELGVTVLLTEHRLEEAFPLASQVVMMERGRVLCTGTPEEVGQMLRRENHGMFLAMPAPMRVWAAVENLLPCPVTVREGRAWLSQLDCGEPALPAGEALPVPEGPAAVELKEVWFRYDREAPDVVKGVSFQAFPGELTAVLGGNGTGKSTMLSLIAGLNRPDRGRVLIEGKPLSQIPARKRFDGLLGVLPQNPQTLFLGKTVREDLWEILAEQPLASEEKNSRMRNIVTLCQLQGLLEMHPYDLSGGEQQRAALAKVLLLRPRILLLDEPTKGMDAVFKAQFARLLRKLAAAGAAVILVSHDVEFCAEYADRCAMFFDGTVVAENRPRAFFSGNSFYTTSVNRMARGLLPEAVTVRELVAALGGTPPSLPELPEDVGEYQLDPEQEELPPRQSAVRRLTPLRIGILAAAGIALILTVLLTVWNWEGFSSFLSGGTEAAAVADDPAAVWRYAGLMAAFGIEGIVIAVTLSWRRGKPEWRAGETPRRRLGRRTAAAVGVVLILMPLTLFAGSCWFGDRKYYFISLLLILEAMIPFAVNFEQRRPQARELVILAVLSAIGVAGRLAFFMLPQFKPVAAVVILAGVAFGGEAGFLVGAVTAFVSNMFYGQGPLTPWQMFAFGLIGLLAGVLFRKGVLLRSRTALCIFGGLSVFLIYGGLMNPASMLVFQPQPTGTMLWAYYLQGIPFDLVHALATVFFLFVAARPMLEKLDRIKVKYQLGG